MIKPTVWCSVPLCERRRVEPMMVCTEHNLDPEACAGWVLNRKTRTEVANGRRRCSAHPMAGSAYCEAHGKDGPRGPWHTYGHAQRLAAGKLDTMTSVASQELLVRPGAVFVAPPVRSDPIEVFSVEYERTLHRIRWFSFMVEELTAGGNDEKLVFGTESDETITGGLLHGQRTVKRSARLNLWEDALRWERKFLLEQQKVWLAAKLGQRALDIQARHVEYTFEKVMAVATLLGHDSNSPEVRLVLERAFDTSLPIVDAELLEDEDALGADGA